MAYRAISQEEKAQPPARLGVQALALVAVCLSATVICATYLSYLPPPRRAFPFTPSPGPWLAAWWLTAFRGGVVLSDSRLTCKVRGVPWLVSQWRRVPQCN